MIALQRIVMLVVLSLLIGTALVMPTQATVTYYSDRTAFENAASATQTVLTQRFEGECWDEPNGAYPPGFGWKGWYVTYGWNETPPYYMPAPIPASAGMATTDVVTVGAYQQDQRVLRVISETYGTDYGSGQYVKWDKYGAVPDPDDQDFLRIALNPGITSVGMDFLGGVNLEVKVFAGSTLLDTRSIAVAPTRSFVGFTSDSDQITRLEVRITDSSSAAYMDNLTWGSPGAFVKFYTDRTAFDTTASATQTVLTQGFEGECWDEPNGAYPPGFGWKGWYVTYGWNETPPYYMPAPIPASAGLATTDVVRVGAYQQDQRVLRVLSETYGTNYGSGQYVQWDKVGPVPDPNDQNYLTVAVSPASKSVGMDLMGAGSLEIKAFSGAALLDTRTVTLPASPNRTFAGFISSNPGSLITNLQVRNVGTAGAAQMDNLTWGSSGATITSYSDRSTFVTAASATHTVLTQGFEGNCSDEPNGPYPPGFGWDGWYVTYGFNQEPPYYMPTPLPAAAGLATTDVVGINSYQSDQRALRVRSPNYGTDFGSGQYVQWDKSGAVPDPNDQNFLTIGLSPASEAVGMDFLGGGTLEVRVFAGTNLLNVRTVAVDPVRSFVGFISSGDPITKLEVRNLGSAGASNMDNLSWSMQGVLEQVQTPVFAPAGGRFSVAQNVAITCGTAGARIYYTTDESTPTELSAEYTGTLIAVSASTVLKAKAFKTGILASNVGIATYRIQNSFNRPMTIPYSNSITVDGNLADWAGSEWAPLDQPYDGFSTDIAEGSYAAKWKEGKVYIAVKVRDTAHWFTDTYEDWNARDAVELYIHTTGDSGTDYPSTQADAQEYAIGFKTTGTDLWSTVGYNPPDGNPIPSGAFAAAGSKDGQWLYYEAELTPYHFFSLNGVGLEVSPLFSGEVISLDVVAVAHNGTYYTGMASENMRTGKSNSIGEIGLHLLVSASDIAQAKTAADGAGVAVSGVVSAAFTDYFYVESPDRAYGIRVKKASHGLAIGQAVAIRGVVFTLDSGERYIAPVDISIDGSGDILPLAVTNKSLGGGNYGTAPNYQVGVEGGVGLNNIGLLVRTTGVVKDSGDGWFTIDDGSGVIVKVFGYCPIGVTRVLVTGISSCEKGLGGVVKPIIDTVNIQPIY